MSTDGRSLTYSFTGAQEGTGPCQEIYKGVVAESSTAVAVATPTVPHERLNDGLVACTLIGYQRSVQVALATALAGRVVVDSRGCSTGMPRGHEVSLLGAQAQPFGTPAVI